MLDPPCIESSNNQFIDADHVDLVQSIKVLNATWLDFGPSDPFTEACVAFVNELRQHFSHEEVILRGAGYEHLNVHIDAHNQILTILEAILKVGIDENTGAYFLDKVQGKLFEHELVADHGYSHLFESHDFSKGKALRYAAQMATGNPHIDDHHKALLDQISQITHHIENGITGKSLVRELEQLHALSTHHFHEEEVELVQDCSASARHRQALRSLLEDLEYTIDKVRNDKLALQALPTYLGLWLTNHAIANDAAEFSKYFSTLTPAKRDPSGQANDAA